MLGGKPCVTQESNYRVNLAKNHHREKLPWTGGR